MQLRGTTGTRRGVTLIEVLIVVAIMSMVAGGVAVAVIRQGEAAKRKTALTDARTLRGAVKMWWLDGATSCPSVAQLIQTGTLDEDNGTVDPWGTPWRILCDGTSVSVSSDGPDRERDTEDDIRVPPIERTRPFTAPSADL
jgi:general secretion pathway protein G